MIFLKIDIGQDQVDQTYSKLTQEIQQVASNTIDTICNFIVDQARHTNKFAHGNVFNEGIKFEKLSATQGQVTSEVYSNKGTEYSQFMEYGNGPQGSFIYPTVSKYLHFFVYGNEVFAKQVHTIDQSKLGFMSDAEQMGE